jgi:hypothetical protein
VTTFSAKKREADITLTNASFFKKADFRNQNKKQVFKKLRWFQT